MEGADGDTIDGRRFRGDLEGVAAFVLEGVAAFFLAAILALTVARLSRRRLRLEADRVYRMVRIIKYIWIEILRGNPKKKIQGSEGSKRDESLWPFCNLFGAY